MATCHRELDLSYKHDANQPRRYKPVTIFFIILIHLAAVAVFCPHFFSWAGVVLFAVMSFATIGLGVSMGYHRLLSHKSYKARPWLRYLLAGFGCLALEMGPIAWSATHRLHHRESDHEDDPHSPLVSFFWSHLGWMFKTHPVLNDADAVRRLTPDLQREPVLRFMDRWFYLFWVTFAALSIAIGYAFGGWQLGLSLFVWGSLARTVWVWHATWFVNSVTHLFGYRNYNTADDSRNLWWVAVCTCGEGWHNNHHAMAGSANYGRRWWEFDPVYAMIVACHRLGWIEKVNVTPPLKPDERLIDLAGKAAALSRALPSALRGPHPAYDSARD